MTLEQLRKLYHARPFRPFEIHLADGEKVHVNHPELLSIPPPGRTVIIIRPDDTVEIIDLLLVTRLFVRGSGPDANDVWP